MVGQIEFRGDQPYNLVLVPVYMVATGVRPELGWIAEEGHPLAARNGLFGDNVYRVPRGDWDRHMAVGV